MFLRSAMGLFDFDFDFAGCLLPGFLCDQVFFLTEIF